MHLLMLLKITLQIIFEKVIYHQAQPLFCMCAIYASLMPSTSIIIA